MTTMVDFASIPSWLEALLAEKFFNACLVHEEEKKNKENTFCLDCCIAVCPHCLPSHQPHHLLQIRRYIYKDVLQLKDAEKLMDCSEIQPYKTNGEKVVFLNHRPIPKRSSDNKCFNCDRNLQRPYFYCSIYCKDEYLGISEFVISKEVLLKNASKVHHIGNSKNVENEQNSTSLEVENSQVTSVGTSSKAGTPSTATTEIVKEKLSSVSVISSTTAEITIAAPKGRRRPRKGVPHRSPLF